MSNSVKLPILLFVIAAALLTPAVAQAGFGLSTVSITAVNRDHSVDRQAGSHPWAFDVNVGLNADAKGLPEGTLNSLAVALPPGLVGDPQAVAQCTAAQFVGGQASFCPGAAQIGIAHIRAIEGEVTTQAVYNLVPNALAPAVLGFNIFGFTSDQVASVRTGDDYGVTVADAPVPNLGVEAITEEIWGVPGDSSHDAERVCINPVNFAHTEGCSVSGADAAFLSLPTDCAAPLQATVSVTSLEEPANVQSKTVSALSGSEEPAALTGCAVPPFAPSVTARPDSVAADSPAGLAVDVHLPQSQSPESLATAHLKNAVVTLPAGLVVNPSAAAGLGACSESEIGFKGSEDGSLRFTPSAAECPDASKLGTVSIESPLLDHPITGSVYLARQDENPFGSLLALYIAVADPKTGIVVKLPGKVTPDPLTGQLTATFENNPQLPFEDLHVDFFGGARAALTTPSTCRTYTTSTDLTPWTSPAGQDARPSDSFAISSGAGGGPCPSGGLSNAPSVEAGTVTPLAGAFSPFVFKVSREDGSARLGSITAVLPEGVLGKLAGVPYCSEAQIATATARSGEGEGALEQASPSCPEASQVGVVGITAGAGPEPYPVQGRVYLAGPYKNAPLSLAVVTPAVAGPFDLGTVVVRVALYINPNTAQISAVSDPIPSILDGIPLDVRSVSLEMNRAGFTFNPTSCEAMSVTGQEISTVGQAAGLSSRFQVGGCQGLAFKPSLTASTVGKASKAGGASLTVKISQKPGEADIHKVDLTLPKTLPARLTTLQQACTEAQFNTNPANCPPGAFIGTATATTPILSVPLTGPAILVSHGGAAFPDVEFLLQADERGSVIQIDLDGKTDIKKGVTYSRFETVPDAPITSFETILNQGPHSILGTNLPESLKYSLCGQKLTIPTTITGQNGAQTTPATPISVTGCSTSLSFTHKIKKKTLTLTVYAPAAGKITATGKGLSTQSKTAKGQEHLTITLKQKQAGKQKTTVKVLFTPSTGKDRKKQTKNAKLTFAK